MQIAQKSVNIFIVDRGKFLVGIKKTWWLEFRIVCWLNFCDDLINKNDSLESLDIFNYIFLILKKIGIIRQALC